MESAAAQDGSTWAAQLYDECAAEMVLYCRALGLAHAEAEDVLHDAFRALLELPERPREPRFYLVRTIRNRSLNHRRSLWRRLAREMESERWFETDTDTTADENACLRALVRLPPEQREVIVLKLWHQLTFEAIGELAGVSPNTAAGRYRYGLQKLRTCLKEPDDELVRTPRGNPAWLSSPPPLPDG